jgi:hypothetical protein
LNHCPDHLLYASLQVHNLNVVTYSIPPVPQLRYMQIALSIALL